MKMMPQTRCCMVKSMQKEKNKMISFLVLVAYIICGSFGMVLIRKGGFQTTIAFLDGKFTVSITPVFLFGLLLYVISFLLWIYILQLFPLTYISPIVYGIVYTLVCILSSIFLKEVVSLRVILGTAMVVGGVILASIKS